LWFVPKGIAATNIEADRQAKIKAAADAAKKVAKEAKEAKAKVREAALVESRRATQADNAEYEALVYEPSPSQQAKIK